MTFDIGKLKEMKQRGEKIVMLTAYDYATAQAVDEAGIPLILVGDSLGMVVLGYDSTVPVTMAEMLHHTAAVARGAKNAIVIGDMPFMTYYNDDIAMANAARFIQEAGANTVKLEGGVSVADRVKRLVANGIPVMGHIGLTPQSVNQFGGYKVQGKTPTAARNLVADAKALDEAGAFAIVLELVPAPLAAYITRLVSTPTIGIGAGPDCDGQVQVINDILGSFSDFVPRHARRYANISTAVKEAVSAYRDDVAGGSFPTAENSSSMDASIIAALEKE